jgi:hypothetical protein
VEGKQGSRTKFTKLTKCLRGKRQGILTGKHEADERHEEGREKIMRKAATELRGQGRSQMEFGNEE